MVLTRQDLEPPAGPHRCHLTKPVSSPVFRCHDRSPTCSTKSHHGRNKLVAVLSHQLCNLQTAFPFPMQSQHLSRPCNPHNPATSSTSFISLHASSCSGSSLVLSLSANTAPYTQKIASRTSRLPRATQGSRPLLSSSHPTNSYCTSPPEGSFPFPCKLAST